MNKINETASPGIPCRFVCRCCGDREKAVRVRL
jgi:hypothetical protein